MGSEDPESAENHPNILHGPKVLLETPNTSLGEFIFTALKGHNPYDVLMCEAESGRTATPPEFLSLSSRVAEALRESGLRPGNVVCVMGRAGIDVYATATGTLFQGGVVFPLDHNMQPDVFRLLLKTTEPKFVFCDSEISEEVAGVLYQLGNPAPVILLDHDHDKETSFPVFEHFIKASVGSRSFRPVSRENAKEDVAFLVCSSGTTGTPKPVMITGKNLLYQIKVWIFLGSVNKILSCPAITFSYFFWISGVLLYLNAIAQNFEMTIVQKLEAKHVLHVIERCKPTWGMFSPALVNHLTNHPQFKSYNVSSLVLLVTGGCALQKVLVRQVKELWGPQVACRQSYGLTELSGSATASNLEDDVFSAGRLLPGFQLKVISLKDGRILGPREEGEIFLKSPSVMKGYLKNEEATTAVLKNNWYRTGDLGYYSDSGLLYVTGRIKDLILLQNEQISPVEIEEVILTVSGVVDVGVAGVKVSDENSVPTALVVKAKGSDVTEEDVTSAVSENLPESRQLRGGVFFVDAIPRTPSGKMKRLELQSLANSLFTEKQSR